MFKVTLALGALISKAEAYTTFGATCPTVTTVENFDTTRYLGTWYEIMRDKTQSFEWDSTCVTARYDDNGDGLVKVQNRGRAWYFFGAYFVAEGFAIFNRENIASQANVNFNPFA